MGKAAAKGSAQQEAKADEKPAAQALTFLALPESLPANPTEPVKEEPTPAEKARATRDKFAKEARDGMKRIADFKGDASECAKAGKEGFQACVKAQDEQKKALRQMRSIAQTAARRSKKAGQEAWKLARKAGASEQTWETERDEVESEAERLEEQAERETEKKGTDRLERLFEPKFHEFETHKAAAITVEKNAATAATNTLAAESLPRSKSVAVVMVAVWAIGLLSAAALVVRRRAAVTTPSGSEEPFLYQGLQA